MEKMFTGASSGYDFFIKHEDIAKEPVLTMVFGAMQPVGEIYTPDEAFKNGTLFKNLDKPFLGRNAYVK